MRIARKFLSDERVSPEIHGSSVGTATDFYGLMQDYMPWAQKQIQPVLQFSENYDGYGAVAPYPDLIKLAIDLLAALKVSFRALPDPVVSPTPTGGVSIEWEEGPRYMEIEIDPIDGVVFLYTDPNSNVRRHGQITIDRQNNLDPGFLLSMKLLFN